MYYFAAFDCKQFSQFYDVINVATVFKSSLQGKESGKCLASSC